MHLLFSQVFQTGSNPIYLTSSRIIFQNSFYLTFLPVGSRIYILGRVFGVIRLTFFSRWIWRRGNYSFRLWSWGRILSFIFIFIIIVTIFIAWRCHIWIRKYVRGPWIFQNTFLGYYSPVYIMGIFFRSHFTDFVQKLFVSILFLDLVL